MEELVKTVEFVSTKYDELLTKQNNLEAANVELQKENQLLKIQVFYLQNNAAQTSDNLNDLEHFGRRDCLEICGIPVKREENTDELVRSVGDLIDAGIKPEDISISHRLISQRSTPNSPPAITLKLICQSHCTPVRDKLYSARKHLQNKTTTDLGLGRTFSNKIYLAKSLIRKNKNLKCWQTKKSLNYKFIWTNQGRIYLRKDSSSPARIVSTEKDLEAITGWSHKSQI